MRTTVLHGEYDLSIDDKNRLLIPAEVRKALDSERDGNGFFLVVGVNRRAWLYPELGYEAMVAKLASEMAPDEDMLAFDQMNFAMADRVEPDKQGRVLINDRSRKRTGLGTEITLIGVRDHLEMWNRTDWNIRREELLTHSAEIALKARAARKINPQMPSG